MNGSVAARDSVWPLRAGLNGSNGSKPNAVGGVGLGELAIGDGLAPQWYDCLFRLSQALHGAGLSCDVA